MRLFYVVKSKKKLSGKIEWMKLFLSGRFKNMLRVYVCVEEMFALLKYQTME